MDLRKIGWEDVDWILLAQDEGQWRAFVNTVKFGFFTPQKTVLPVCYVTFIRYVLLIDYLKYQKIKYGYSSSCSTLPTFTTICNIKTL
jgi:hypothetical protein